MKKICVFVRTRAAIKIILLSIFASMLVLNCLTPYVADDFVYMFSFSTKERLTSAADIIPSMYVHSLRMNGRVISHSLEQLFMLMPKLLFNISNALVYTMAIYLLYRIANHSKKTNGVLLAAISMGFWCMMPAFGQIALWQVGSVNYLWAITGCLGFLLPYLVYYYKGSELLTKCWQRGAFCLASLLFGMYSEISSFAAICLGAGILIICAIQKKQSLKSWLLLPLGMACIGYIIMLCIPAQISAKAANGLSMQLLLNNFIRASCMLFKYCWIMLFVWALSFAAGVRKRISSDRLLLSALFLTVAVMANYMTIIAAYYPERCLCTTVTLLILAISIILADIQWNYVTEGGFAALTVCSAILFCIGSSDIVNCWMQFTARESVIAQAKESGETDLILGIVEYDTMYSAFWNLRDLSNEERETWPNSSMAKYYGVNSILGK